MSETRVRNVTYILKTFNVYPQIFFFSLFCQLIYFEKVVNILKTQLIVKQHISIQIILRIIYERGLYI